jgi:hypothetical protein
MYGEENVLATAIAAPSALNATPYPVPVGSVAGLVYFVPKPALDQGYVVMYGLVVCATAIAVPLGLNATPCPSPVGSVEGFAYFVPKPVALDQGYAVMNVEPYKFDAARVAPSGLNATSVTVENGSVLGEVYFVPNPVAFDQGYAFIYEEPPSPIAIAAPSGLNATPYPLYNDVTGLVYFVPKPVVFDQGYAVTFASLPDIVGVTIAMAAPSGLNATPYPVEGASVDGFEYFVPKPALDQA